MTTRTHTLHETIRRAAEDALTAVMNAHAPDCGPLFWFFAGDGCVWHRTGQLWGLAASGTTGDARRMVVQQWARTFDLAPDSEAIGGTVAVHGAIEAVPVRVWAITDYDAYNAASADPLRRMPHGAGESGR